MKKTDFHSYRIPSIEEVFVGMVLCADSVNPVLEDMNETGTGSWTFDD